MVINAVLYGAVVPISVIKLYSRHSENIVYRMISAFVYALFGRVLRTQRESALVGKRRRGVNPYLAFVFLIEFFCYFLINFGILSVSRKPYVYVNVFINRVAVSVALNRIGMLPACVKSYIPARFVGRKIPLLSSRRVLVPTRLLHTFTGGIGGNMLRLDNFVPFHARSNAGTATRIVIIERNENPACVHLPRGI